MPRVTPQLHKFCCMDLWQSKLDALEKLALPENWRFSSPRPEARNNKNPILHNYICHTFSKLANDYNHAESDEEKGQLLHIDKNSCVFNTGLFDRNYDSIYAVLARGMPGAKWPWRIDAFVKPSDAKLRGIARLPKRAKYFNKISDLVYNSEHELRINVDHILADQENIQRMPKNFQEMSRDSQKLYFDGAVARAKRIVEANYKAAVPQYYRNQIQMLLPLYMGADMGCGDRAAVALAVTLMNGFYAGFTCLTIDMAYNNARLIARPDSDWLKP